MANLIRAALLAASMIGAAAGANAAELVMVDMKACSYCAKFRHDVAPTYDFYRRRAGGPLAEG